MIKIVFLLLKIITGQAHIYSAIHTRNCICQVMHEIVFRCVPGLGDSCPSSEELSATVSTLSEDTTLSDSETLTEMVSFMEGLGLMPTATLPG